MNSEDIIKKAKAEIGTKESPPNSNNVKYNTWYYGHAVSGSNYPWCMVFQSWLFEGTGLFPKSASCMNTAEWFKNQKRFFTSPQIGDLVFFKYGTNSRWTNHVGLVIGIKGSTVITIEGNTSKDSNDNGGSVMQRKRSTNIVGYGRPAYSESQLPTLLYGSRNDYVRSWQMYLNTQGYDLVVDGIFGKKTENAVKAWQLENGLDVTGIITPTEWNYIGVIS